VHRDAALARSHGCSMTSLPPRADRREPSRLVGYVATPGCMQGRGPLQPPATAAAATSASSPRRWSPRSDGEWPRRGDGRARVAPGRLGCARPRPGTAPPPPLEAGEVAPAGTTLDALVVAPVERNQLLDRPDSSWFGSMPTSSRSAGIASSASSFSLRSRPPAVPERVTGSEDARPLVGAGAFGAKLDPPRSRPCRLDRRAGLAERLLPGGLSSQDRRRFARTSPCLDIRR
jgi:hypothetical protein